MTDSNHSIQATAEQTRTYLRNQAVRQTWPRLDECADVIDALLEQLEAAHEALRGIERYAYDAIRDGHPSIPEMTVVQQRAMRAITSNPASREPS